jgi:uncharacterized protein YdaU (DUF1376 family)
MAKDTLWFKHDTNSRSDDKIIELQMEYGMEGIGVYWCIIEMLYEQMGVMRMQCDRIAFELRAHKNVVEDVLKKYGLFQIDGDIVTNRRVTEELAIRCEVSEKARERADKRWERVRNEQAMRAHSEGNASAMQRREEERREQNNREEKITFESDEKKTALSLFEKKQTAIAPRNVPHDEFHAYFTELGYPQEADKFIDYYSSNGWKVGRNAMKDWKATARRWVRRNHDVQADKRLVRDTKMSDAQRNIDNFVELMNQTKTNDTHD